MAGENTLHFDDETTFENEVLKAELPVLVDFWAEWCGPCQMVAPIIDELANEYKGRVKVGKLDVDKAPQIAGRFNVQNIPTVLLFRGGQPIERIVGMKRKNDYRAIIDAKLGAA